MQQRDAPLLAAAISLVRIAPLLAVIGVVVGIPAILAVFGLSVAFAPLMMYGGGYGGGMLYTVFAIVTLVLEALSITGLFAKSYSGWKFAFYAVLVTVIENLVSYNLSGVILGGGIGLYFLFQVRSYYN